MSYTRRTFLKHGAAVASTTALLPNVLRGASSGTWLGTGAPHNRELASDGTNRRAIFRDPQVKEFVQRALDAARSAGATYADVRYTHTTTRAVSVLPTPIINDGEDIVVGVRALVQGYWGFATSPLWAADEMTRLGREAVAQAQTNLLTRPRIIDLVPAPVISDGEWTTKVAIDPFTIYPVEILDYLQSLSIFIRRFPQCAPISNNCMFVVQDKAFGSTEGSYYIQRYYRSQGSLEISMTKPGTRESVRGGLDTLTPASVGFELYRGQPLRDNVRAVVERLKEDLSLPVQPVDVNHYDVVLDAASLSHLVSATLGAASELDRALGYEANAGGTSYLNDPSSMMRTFTLGSPLLSVTANRSEPGGAATVQWDDDGVVPRDISVVTNGVFQEYQTTRESAGWLKAQIGTTAPTGSCGSASAPDANSAPVTHTANLVMRAGAVTDDFDSLVRGMKRGLAIRDLGMDMDFQQLNGFAIGGTYDVRNGKKFARLAGAATLFRAPELWRSLIQVGGTNAARRFGHRAWKGEPMQDSYHSVTAVPGVFKDMTIIDALRKA